jgi:UDP-glucose 4-epimerase
MLIHRNSTALTPSRVVVLGAHGFVAARLIRLLRDEGIACRPVGSAEVDLIAVSGATKLREILRLDDTVVVTSALTREKGRDRATFLKNVAMIDNLCNCLAVTSCAHVVYVSSDSVYNSGASLVNEQTGCESNDLYALAHIVREKLLAEACQSANIPLAIVRPCAIYGAGDSHDSYGPNRFLRTAQSEGRITLFGQGEEERDHVYVDDVTRIILKCSLHGSTGVLNAVSGMALTFAEVARKMVAVIERPVSIETTPRRVPIVHKRFDPAALFQAFPSFVATPFEEGIRKSLAKLSNIKAGLAAPGSAP